MDREELEDLIDDLQAQLDDAQDDLNSSVVVDAYVGIASVLWF